MKFREKAKLCETEPAVSYNKSMDQMKCSISWVYLPVEVVLCNRNFDRHGRKLLRPWAPSSWNSFTHSPLPLFSCTLKAEWRSSWADTTAARDSRKHRAPLISVARCSVFGTVILGSQRVHRTVTGSAGQRRRWVAQLWSFPLKIIKQCSAICTSNTKYFYKHIEAS